MVSDKFIILKLLLIFIFKSGIGIKLGSEFLKGSSVKLGREKLKSRHKCCRW
jgi:hypothetical protein